MADQAISELLAAATITQSDLFVLEQNGTAKKLTGQTLINDLLKMLDGHGGIQSITKVSTDVLQDTYRILFADTTFVDFVVTNGRGITSITKTNTVDLVDYYSINYNDGSAQTFEVANGAKGDQGDASYVWIKYASQKPTDSSSSFGDLPDDWMGVHVGTEPSAPTDYSQYTWFKIKGEQGDTGAPATLVYTAIEYQASTSGTIIPSGTWTKNVPVVPQGQCLWTRFTQRFNTGDDVVAYAVSRMGLDGLGSVVSVAGISPNEAGNVPLTAADIEALPSTGGSMTGPINMNGQQLLGLNDPSEATEAARKSYVDAAEKRATNVRNLLVNSDFRNPVNQRGATEYTSGYSIDRWRTTGMRINDGSITVNDIGSDPYFQQHLSPSVFKNCVHTLVAKRTDGTIICMVYNPLNAYTEKGMLGLGLYNNDVICRLRAGEYVWAALYEGEYTAETLPPYVPIGYGVEVVNCNGGAIAMELLWENASVSSSFNAQTLSLDLSEYDFILLISVFSNSFGYYSSDIINVTNGISYVANSHPNDRGNVSRRIKISSNSIQFYTGLESDNSEDSSVMKPVKIYGIKGVQK